MDVTFDRYYPEEELSERALPQLNERFDGSATVLCSHQFRGGRAGTCAGRGAKLGAAARKSLGSGGLLQGWLTFFVPGVPGPEGCCYAEKVSAGVQA